MLNGLSSSWSWGWGVFLALLIPTVLYIVGLQQMRARHRQGDGATPAVSVWREISFGAGIILTALTLFSPLDTIAQTQLFTAHMVQVILLSTVCAPLIMAGCPDALMSMVLEIRGVQRVARFLTRPLVASIVFNAVFLVWSIPALYDAGIGNSSIYHLMMLCIFFASWLNWFPLIGPLHDMHRMSYPMKIFYAFFDGVPMELFAFILVFTGVPIYAYHAIPAQLNMSAFSDQAIGGALLLIPGVVDVIVMAPLFFLWMKDSEEKARLADIQRAAGAGRRRVRG